MPQLATRFGVHTDAAHVVRHAQLRTGLLLIAHAPLGEAFVKVAKHVFGTIDSPLRVLDVHADTSSDEAVRFAQLLVAGMNCAEVLILVDIHGGPTPCVIARRVCEALSDRAQLVGGLNAAMLLTALESVHLDAHSLAQIVVESGRGAVLSGLPA